MNISGLSIYIIATIIYMIIGAYGIYVLRKIDITLNKTNILLTTPKGQTGAENGKKECKENGQ